MKTGKEITSTTHKPKELYAATLLGTDVKNPAGETVGKIKELVIDPKDARITTAVVSMGSFLGMGGKAVAVPWNDVKLSSDGKTVVVAMAKEQLESAPSWKQPEEETRAPMQRPTTLPGAPMRSPGPQ